MTLLSDYPVASANLDLFMPAYIPMQMQDSSLNPVIPGSAKPMIVQFPAHARRFMCNCALLYRDRIRAVYCKQLATWPCSVYRHCQKFLIDHLVTLHYTHEDENRHSRGGVRNSLNSTMTKQSLCHIYVTFHFHLALRWYIEWSITFVIPFINHF